MNARATISLLKTSTTTIKVYNVGGDAVPSNDVLHNSNSNCLQPLSIGHVKLLLNIIDTSKATCADDFPSWVSKERKEDICIPLHNIINGMLAHGQYPVMWKRAQVTPVPKSNSLQCISI